MAGFRPGFSPMNKRIRKMGYQPRKNVYRQIQLVPALLLAGVWLQKAGFEHGQSVTVTVENGQILISK